jgi:hypothetical protein
MDRRITVAEAWPRGWRERLAGGRLGVGGDIATTTNKKSNPSALAVIEEYNSTFYVRALVRWKTADPDVWEAMLREAVTLPSAMRARRVCLDATSEKFFAKGQQRRLSGTVPVELVVASENTTYLGEKMLFKIYLGNLLINTLDNNHLALPDERWLASDLRSVTRDRGSFVYQLAEDGGHADCFVAIALGLHALKGAGGPATAAGAQVGSFGQRLLRKLRNPFAGQFENQGGKLHV